MKQYEYKQIILARESYQGIYRNSSMNLLKDYGNKGWLVIDVEHNSNSDNVLLCREKDSESKFEK